MFRTNTFPLRFLSRLMCKAYLTFFMRDDLLDEMPLYPYPDPSLQGNSDASAEVFLAPSVTYSYDQVGSHEVVSKHLASPWLEGRRGAGLLLSTRNKQCHSQCSFRRATCGTKS